MEERDNTRKKYIRNLAVVFFTALFILTFCSNTIMNLALPQVTVTRLKSGTIYNKVRGSGKVEAVHHYEVKADREKKIAYMSVSEGDTVSQNQVLFLYEDGKNQELEAEKETLSSLQLEYQKSLLEMGNEYGTSNLVIQSARDELLAAMEKKEQASAAQGEIASLKQSIQQKSEETKKLEDAAKKAQEKLENAGIKEDSAAIEQEIQAMERELEGLNIALGDLQADLQSAIESGNGQEETRLTREIRDKEKEITYKEQDLEEKKAAGKAAKKSNKAIEKLETKAAETKADYESKAAELAGEKERLSLLEADVMSLEDAEALVKDKEIALKSLLLEARKDNLDFQNLSEKVRKQETEVESLEANEAGREVCSPVAGIISEISYGAGDTVFANETVATINMIEEGYTVSFPVTLEQSKYVSVGNEASVLNVWDESANAKLISIKANPEDPNRSRVLTFRVWGEEIAPGQSLAISVGEMREEYEAIVPRNAVYEDNQGKFVYALRIKTTPLGNRYLAERKPVEVLASDDTYAAISADLGADGYIITESIAPIEDGMKVRLVD
ncbi:MAG: HlyD family efflux transporter periplasmic adaptor subunit [Roseburia sp.]|nr:HlyD family efflux transporter periplasmic adaptor subunit [Roseburia sp.]MCM1279068.1 HlyD family efflux transporter periplasmic adaptor subunit [Robinsoniella sp.]